MRLTLSCPGAGLPVFPGDPALGALREFRERLHGCLTARADALFELADAVLCSDRPVRSLVQLSLEPEFRRGHGALYDALAAGRVDDERLFSLLTEVLPPLVDGPEARAWIAEHDVIGRRLLDRALSGVPAADAARVRDACARWRRVAGRGRRDVLSPAGRVVLPRAGACPPRGLPLQGLQQDHARLGVPARRRHRPPAHRLGRGRRRAADHPGHPHRADDRPGQERAAPPARRRARQRGGTAVRLRRRLQRRRADRRAGRAAPRTSWSGFPPGASSTRTRSPGPAGTAAPPTAARRSTAWSRRPSRRPPRGMAAGAGRSRCPRPLSRTRP